MSLTRPHFLRDATGVPNPTPVTCRDGLEGHAHAIRMLRCPTCAPAPAPTPVTERHLVSATDRLIAQVCDADRRSTLREHIHVSALTTAGGAK